MTIGDILLYAFLFGITFFAGRLSMMHSIVKAVISEHENSTVDQPGILKIEKINNIYYAYVDTDFAGQAGTFDELFTNMAKNHRFNEWKINELPKDFSDEEKELMFRAIEKNFTSK